MKIQFLTFTLLFISTFSYAARNLILEPIFSSHEFETGIRLEIRTSNERDKLVSVKFYIGENIVSVPEDDLDVVNNPVISAIKISGGTVGSHDIETPRYVTIGFGAYHCELRECPGKITYIFSDGKYQEYFVEGKEHY